MEHQIENRPFTDLPIPFATETRQLLSGTFRHSEVHVVCLEEVSDPRVFRKLEEMGLYPARYQEKNGTGLVYTIQGFRDEIRKIFEVLVCWLDKVGGLAEAKLWRETIVWSWMSRPDYQLPPVVSKINCKKH